MSRRTGRVHMRGAGRVAARLVVAAALVYAAHLALDWTMARGPAGAEAEGMSPWTLALLIAAYALLLSIPFVPGVELGIMLMAIEGAWVAPFVYLGTVVGLMLSFLVGGLTPPWLLRGVLRDLGLSRACGLLDRIEAMDPDERLALLRRRLPSRLSRLLVGRRYLLFAILLNLPGSSAIGGGGGIALAAGFSRLFTGWRAFLTVALAVAPVPLAVWALDLHLAG